MSQSQVSNKKKHFHLTDRKNSCLEHTQNNPKLTVNHSEKQLEKNYKNALSNEHQINSKHFIFTIKQLSNLLMHNSVSEDKISSRRFSTHIYSEDSIGLDKISKIDFSVKRSALKLKPLLTPNSCQTKKPEYNLKYFQKFKNVRKKIVKSNFKTRLFVSDHTVPKSISIQSMHMKKN